jgi:putative SOS response-associated peptidase YedK
MCGRFFLDAKAGDILEHYNASPPDLFTARYNIAPSTPVLAFSGAGFDLYRWGLIPSWAKDLTIGQRARRNRCRETIVSQCLPASALPGAGQRVLRMAPRKRP